MREVITDAVTQGIGPVSGKVACIREDIAGVKEEVKILGVCEFRVPEGAVDFYAHDPRDLQKEGKASLKVALKLFNSSYLTTSCGLHLLREARWPRPQTDRTKSPFGAPRGPLLRPARPRQATTWHYQYY